MAMDLASAQKYFTKLVGILDGEKERAKFIEWVINTNCSNYNCNGCKSATSSTDGSNADVYLDSITADLRKALPVNALYESENITFPTVGENSLCNPANTVHVDSFLYDDDTIDTLCDEGKLQRNYCNACGSRDVQPLTYISHSSSRGQLTYIFRYLLPDLAGKTLLDVGSRLGAVLYAAYLYSSASKVIGVEINPDFCTLQKGIIDKYKMADRVQVINADICNQSSLIEKADVLILQNVFEFFAPLEVQTRIWEFLHRTCRRPGTILITNPSLEQSLKNLQTNIEVDKWVKKSDLEILQKDAGLKIYGPDADDDDSDLENLHLYTVL